MPAPEPVRGMVRVGIDRTVSGGPLPKSSFIAGKDTDFGLFERSILRLGYFTFRATGEELTDADAVIVGKLLVLDRPGNAGSTANSLLWPYGLKVGRTPLPAGPLTVRQGWPAIQVPSAKAVSGGQPLASLHGQPVAAAVRYGKGTVTVVGFSSRFTDRHMGVIGDVIPDARLRPVYDFEYKLLRSVVRDDLPGVTPSASGSSSPRTTPSR